MRAFLPAGTEVVISRNGSYEWYTTVKTVELVNGYSVAPCPLRNALPVLTAEVKGFRVWFLENQLEVSLSDEMTTFVNNHKFVKVEYDIPVRVMRNATNHRDENGRPFTHPSTWMWGYGVRTSESVWLMTAEKYQALGRRLRGLTRAGCQWTPTNVDASDAAKHFMRAIIAMRKAWVEADQSYETCLNNAEEEYQTGNQSVEAERKLRYARTRIEKELDKKRENITSACGLYGIPLDWISKGTVPAATVSTVNGSVAIAPTASTVKNVTKADAKAKTEAHCNMVDALRNAGHTKEANAVESGSMSHEYAADFCEENGILCDENGGFSLRDVFKD